MSSVSTELEQLIAAAEKKYKQGKIKSLIPYCREQVKGSIQPGQKLENSNHQIKAAIQFIDLKQQEIEAITSKKAQAIEALEKSKKEGLEVQEDSFEQERRNIEENFEEALEEIGNHLRKNFDIVFAAALEGNQEAQFCCAVDDLYDNFWMKSIRQKAISLGWLQAFAELGYAKAQFKLGEAYRTANLNHTLFSAINFPKLRETGHALFLSAAEQGYIDPFYTCATYNATEVVPYFFEQERHLTPDNIALGDIMIHAIDCLSIDFARALIERGVDVNYQRQTINPFLLENFNVEGSIAEYRNVKGHTALSTIAALGQDPGRWYCHVVGEQEGLEKSSNQAKLLGFLPLLIVKGAKLNIPLLDTNQTSSLDIIRENPDPTNFRPDHEPFRIDLKNLFEIIETVTPYFNPGYMQAIANAVELQYLEKINKLKADKKTKSEASLNPTSSLTIDDHLLLDRNLLATTVNEVLTKACEVLFQKDEGKLLDEAAEKLKTHRDNVKSLLKKVLHFHLKICYLYKRQSIFFWKPYIEFLLFRESNKNSENPPLYKVEGNRIVPLELPAAINSIVESYGEMSNSHAIGFSEEENEFDKATTDSNLRMLRKLRLETLARHCRDRALANTPAGAAVSDAQTSMEIDAKTTSDNKRNLEASRMDTSDLNGKESKEMSEFNQSTKIPNKNGDDKNYCHSYSPMFSTFSSFYDGSAKPSQNSNLANKGTKRNLAEMLDRGPSSGAAVSSSSSSSSRPYNPMDLSGLSEDEVEESAKKRLKKEH